MVLELVTIIGSPDAVETEPAAEVQDTADTEPAAERQDTEPPVAEQPDAPSPQENARDALRAAKSLAAQAHRYRRRGKYERAEANYRRALGKRKTYPPALAGLARTLLLRGRAREASRLARRAVRSRPRVGVYWVVLGDALTQRGDRAGARAAYEAAAARGARVPARQGAPAMQGG